MRKYFAPLASVLIATVLAFMASTSGTSPVYAAAGGSYPTPAPTALPTGIPANIPQVAILSGCFHNSNGNCPSPSVNGQVADWQYLGTRVPYVETDARAYGLCNAGSIQCWGYMDPVWIHGGITYNATTSFCPSDASPLPLNILSHMRDYGEVGQVPNANQTTCGGNTVATEIGDITQPQAASFWHQVYRYNNAFGTDAYNTAQNPTGLSLVRVDDYLAPFLNNPSNTLVCQGPAHLTTSGTIVSCSSYSGSVSQITQDLYPFNALPYPHAIPAWYVNGARNFMRSWKDLGFGTVVNNDTDPTTTDLFYGQPDHANVFAMQCENCITRNGGSLWSETIWQNHINAEIVTTSQGVVYHAFNVVESVAGDPLYTYVSLGLGAMDFNKVAVTEQCGGSISVPTSGICISPASLVVPTQPRNDPANINFNPFAIGYNPNTPPQNVGVATLKHNGFYSREFVQCYVNQTAIGNCAYVLNPPGGSTQTITGLQGTYAHQIAITGTGILTATGFGDTYTITYNSSAAPTSLTAGSAAILTP